MRHISRSALVLGGLVASTGISAAPELSIKPPDPRIARVETFFNRYDCPAPRYSEYYVKMADRYDVDYRLLPAISMMESTCGMFQRLNNHWGWNSAKTGFPTVESGIEHVIRQLATGTYYRNRDLEAKLLSYNPRPEYGETVMRLMRQIDVSQRN